MLVTPRTIAHNRCARVAVAAGTVGTSLLVSLVAPGDLQHPPWAGVLLVAQPTSPNPGRHKSEFVDFDASRYSTPRSTIAPKFSGPRRSACTPTHRILGSSREASRGSTLHASRAVIVAPEPERLISSVSWRLVISRGGSARHVHPAHLAMDEI